MTPYLRNGIIKNGLLRLYTGLRIGELCGLKWEDIDFNNKILKVRRTMQRVRNFEGGENKTEIALLSPKTKSSRRDIPLPTFLIELLKRRYIEESALFSKLEFVISREGKYIEPRSVQYHFNKLLDEAKVETSNFHALRHTFAVRALESQFDIQTLSELLGHKSAAVTLAHYAHSLIEHKRNSMESLEAIFNK